MFSKRNVCKILAGAIAISAINFILPDVYAAEQGDINNDGWVNIIDSITMRSMLTGEKATDNSADLDGDGRVNVKDIIIMNEYLCGVRDSLPQITQNQNSQKTVTSVNVSDDICIRADGDEDSEKGIINVAGYNAAIRRNVYLKFPADSLELNDVKRAQINLKLARTANGDCEVKLYAYNSNWSEQSPPEYKEFPDTYGLCDVVVTQHPDDAGSVIQFDVTDVVRENPQAKEFNFVLVCDHENNSDAVSNLALFHSRESSDKSGVPQLVVESGGEDYENAVAIEADNEYVRLETATKSGTFLRVKENKLTSGRNVSPLTDAKFNEKTGFAGSDTVSLESVSKPGWYLCRKSGSSEIILAQNDNSEQFRKNASFIKTKGLSKGTSYQMYSLPQRYLMCTGSEYYISYADTEQEKLKASFMVRSQKNVIMKDEFEGNALNTDIWAYSYPWSDHHNYSAVVRQSQVAVKDGKLVLTATRVADDNWIKDKNGETGYTDKIGENKWRKYSHLTGVVHLPFSRYPLSGNVYIEGRFRMPDKSGFWPAFWLNGNNSWPPEIDIFEYLSNTPEKIYVGIHRQDSSKPNGDGGAGWWITKTASFFQQQFHTYALDWGETYINYYIDDVLVKTVDDQAFIKNQKNMYMIINLGVGGWAAEPTDSVGENTTYECDFVRIYGY